MTPRYVPGCFDVARRAAREAADVHLVDDRLGERPPQVAVAFPIERVVDDHALRRADDAVVGRQKLAGQCPGVRIDQPGLRIEALALRSGRTGRRPGSDRAARLRGRERTRSRCRPSGRSSGLNSITRLGSRSVTVSYSSTRIAVAERL